MAKPSPASENTHTTSSNNPTKEDQETVPKVPLSTSNTQQNESIPSSAKETVLNDSHSASVTHPGNTSSKKKTPKKEKVLLY